MLARCSYTLITNGLFGHILSGYKGRKGGILQQGIIIITDKCMVDAVAGRTVHHM